MMEAWRIVKEFPKYEVSNLGRLRQIRNSKLIFQKDHTQGYKQVTLYSGGKAHYRYVHRLVAQAFIPNPSGLPFVNHKDECKTHNWADNLEWCTYEHNNKEAYRLGLKQSRIKPKRVVQLSKDYKIENVFESVQQIEKTLGYSSGNIVQVCNKKRKSAYGYIWRYADE